MNAVVIYDSKHGNTEQLARAIGARIGALQVLAVEEVEARDLAACGLLIVGGPTHTHGMSVVMRDFVEGLSRGALRGVPAAAFDTRYHGSRLITGAASHGIARHLRRAGAQLTLPPESFFVVREGEPEETRLVEGEIERARSWAATLLHEVAVAREMAADDLSAR
jgi:flavodoxin